MAFIGCVSIEGTVSASENFSTQFIFQCRIRNLWLWLQRCTALEWRWFKDSIIGKDYAAGDVVLQFSNVTGPAVAKSRPAAGQRPCVRTIPGLAYCILHRASSPGVYSLPSQG